MIKKVLPFIVPLAIIGGLFYPVIGFIVPVVMMLAVVVSIMFGRYHCGNFCPRGLFLGNWLPKVFNQKNKKKLPKWVKSQAFRWSFFGVMMVFMIFNIWRNPTDLSHIGQVFWFMCVWTTVLAIVLATKYQSRAWCKICPMGTVQKSFSSSHKDLVVSEDSCKSCNLCTKSCPMDLTVVDIKTKKAKNDFDCTKCNTCIDKCPTKCLTWKYKKAS